MISRPNSFGLRRPAWLAALIVCLTPAVLPAETLVFRNECRSPVVVQTASVVKGVLKRDRAIVLRPGEATPKINLDADKLVTIYDARVPNRVLYKDGVRVSKPAVYLGIIPDKLPLRVKLVPRAAFPAGRGSTAGMPGR